MAGRTQELGLLSLNKAILGGNRDAEQLVSVDDVVNEQPGLVWLEPSLLLCLRICK